MSAREKLRTAIEAALSAYAQDKYGDFGRLHCFREIDALIKRADYFIKLRPDPAEIAAERSDDPRPWPALEMARNAAYRDPQ